MRMGCAVMALALLLGAVPAAAQTRTITGTVTDAETGQPLGLGFTLDVWGLPKDDDGLLGGLGGK